MVYFRQYVKSCVKKAGAIGEGVCIPLCQRALFPLRIFRCILQSRRPDPGNSRSKCFLHMEEGRFIFVALSVPREATESIISMARHEVNMHMGDALTDTVVDGEKRSIRFIDPTCYGCLTM